MICTPVCGTVRKIVLKREHVCLESNMTIRDFKDDLGSKANYDNQLSISSLIGKGNVHQKAQAQQHRVQLNVQLESLQKS